MNKFMFALENLLTTAGLGYKAVVNRSQDVIKNKVMFYQAIDNNSTNYFQRNGNKKTSNRRK